VSAVNPVEYNRGAIRPVECLKSGWTLIKGEYWLFLGISLVGVIIGSVVPMGILMGPMMCGIYFCLLRRMRGEAVDFGGLFKGFDSFGDGLIAGLAQFIPAMVLIMPLYFVFFIGMTTLMPRQGSRGAPPDLSSLITFLIVMGVALLVALVIIMVISALLMFSYPLIVDRKLSGFNAVMTSIKSVFANLGGALGLMMLNVMLGIVGMLFCYVGAILIMPVTLAAWAVAYRQVFPQQS
jgi:hypothetical protein